VIRLVYSNRAEELLGALLERLDDERQRADSPLQPSHVVVPGRLVETAIKLRLARARGLSGPLETRSLRRFLVEVAEASSPELAVVEAQQLMGLVLGALSDDDWLRSSPALGPVAAYLDEGRSEGADDDARAVRRVQLATELGSLFAEYGLSRPELVDAWRRGKSPPVPPAYAETATWQRLVFLRALGMEARLGDGRRPVLLVEALVGTNAPRRLALPPSVHLVLPPPLPRGLHRVLARIAGETAAHVYALNPCLEFWEDIDARRLTEAQLEADDPFGLGPDATVGDSPILRAWGRPGRETIRLLDALSECDFQARFVDPVHDDVSPSLLEAVQHDVLHRAPERRQPAGPPPDGESATRSSIAITGCPSVRRELERIAAEIVRLVEEDAARGGTLQLTDIAVALPAADRASYEAHLAAVFDETHAIPWVPVDVALEATSRVPECARLLFDLPLGKFSDREVLAVALHPLVAGRWPDALTEGWAALVERLGIVDGADHGDHAGTYIARDILNWDQGLRRIALGAFLAGRRSGDARPVEADGERYLPEELVGDEREAGARLALMVRALLGDARALGRARLSLGEWARAFAGLLRTYVVATDEADRRARDRCLGALDALGRIECPGPDGAPVKLPYRAAHALASRAIASLRSGGGQELSRGVVVASLSALRGLPFRVIFVAGLGEGRFPASERRNQLDLRQAQKRAGDVSPREADRWAFLEALLGARERLRLSYVDRDPLTGEERLPSSVLVELREILVRGYLGPDGAKALSVKTPLRRHEDPLVAAVHVGAAREARAAALFGGTRPVRLAQLAELTESLPPALRRSARDLLGLVGLEGGAPRVAMPPDRPISTPAATTRVRVPVAALRKFLECPLQGSVSFLVGMRQERDERDEALPGLESLERLVTPQLVELTLLRGVLMRALADEGDLARAIERRYDEAQLLHELSGETPTGPFAAAERRRHLAALQRWVDVVRPELARRGGRPPEAIRVGPTDAPDATAGGRVLPSVIVPLADGREAEIVGRAESLLFTDEALGGANVTALPVGGHDAAPPPPRTSLVLAKRADEGTAQAKVHRDLLRAFFEHALLTAAGLDPVEHGALVAVTDGERSRRHSARFRALTRDDARTWLGGLAGELTAGVHPYLLPYEAVFVWERNPRSSLVDAIVALRDKKGRFSSHYGPVRRPESYEPPTEHEAREMADRRFGPFWSNVISYQIAPSGKGRS
jgi:exodeoxyribonuclease V gamma subunit